MLILQGPRMSLTQNSYFHGQSFAKYIGNLLDFTDNLKLK